MSFASPFALAWFVPVAGLIVLLHVLKPRRRDIVVSSTFLWEQVLSDGQADARPDRPRPTLLLWLQLLAALLVVAALARPGLRGVSRFRNCTVLVVDLSVTMQASDVLPSRLAAARQQATRLVDKMSDGDTMLLLAAGPRPHIACAFTGDATHLRRALDDLKPDAAPSVMSDALRLAARLATQHSPEATARIELFSDGCFANPANAPSGMTQGVSSPADLTPSALSAIVPDDVGFTFHPVGNGRDNVGIVSLDYRRGTKGTQSGQALVVTRNLSVQPRTLTQEIYLGDTLFDAHEITLSPGQADAQAYDVPAPTRDTRLRARLDVKDDLAADNEAAIILHPHRQIRALLVGSHSPLLEAALRVDSDVVLSQSAVFPALGATDYDVVVFDGAAPAHLPPGHYLFLDCASDQCPAAIEAGNPLDNIEWTDTTPAHRLLRYVDWNGETLSGVVRASAKPWGEEIAGGDSGALLVAGERNGTRAEFAAFSPQTSPHLPLTVSFPIFISNSIHWLSGNDSAADTRDAASPPLALDITPRQMLPIPDHTPARANALNAPAATHDLLPYFTFAALLLLCAEWHVFHRGLPSRTAHSRRSR